jgi:hypothetical protein
MGQLGGWRMCCTGALYGLREGHLPDWAMHDGIDSVTASGFMVWIATTPARVLTRAFASICKTSFRPCCCVWLRGRHRRSMLCVSRDLDPALCPLGGRRTCLVRVPSVGGWEHTAAGCRGCCVCKVSTCDSVDSGGGSEDGG